jgi:hypothetical protein
MNWPICELRPELKTLEDVFKELVLRSESLGEKGVQA